MVTAESLNFDVLQIIFAHLSVSDLASVSQVNRSFLAGALPRLYRSLGFYFNQAKRYPRVGYCHSSPLISLLRVFDRLKLLSPLSVHVPIWPHTSKISVGPLVWELF